MLPLGVQSVLPSLKLQLLPDNFCFLLEKRTIDKEKCNSSLDPSKGYRVDAI